MDDGELIAQVERRPAIWDLLKESGDGRENRTAWRQLCKIQHANFDDLTPGDKRDKCLALQKRWLTLRQAYFRSLRSGPARKKLSGHPPELLAKMAFLANVVPGADSSPIDVDSDDHPPPTSAKRPRTESTASATASTASLPALTPEADEDRHFLLSLVSYMQDVPRPNRLALRSDMIALVAQYSRQATPTTTNDQLTQVNPYLH